MYTDNHERLPEAPEAVKSRRIVLGSALHRIIKAVPSAELSAIPEVSRESERETVLSDLDNIRKKIEQAINEESQYVPEAA